MTESTESSNQPTHLARRSVLGMALGGVAATTLGGSASATPGAAYDESVPADEAVPAGTEFDVVFRGGTVVDGSGRERFGADVGVIGGYVVAVGDLSGSRAETEVDATGLVVAPGFVDVHSHANTTALQEARSCLTQGVTTEILQPDGGGSTNVPGALSVEHTDIGINVGAYIGFNAVWSEVVGREDRQPTEDEITQMQEIVRRGMEDGAWGVSSGIAYVPAVYAETQHITDVVSAARAWRTNYCSHIRNESVDVVESTAECIQIGEDAGLAPVVTHMKVMGPEQWGQTKQTIGMLEEANARGTYAAADVYPYTASQTGLTAIIPDWVEEGGREDMLERFADPDLRPQIATEIEELIAGRVESAADVYFPTRQETLADVAETKGVEPGEAAIQIMEDAGSLRTIYYFGHEDDFRRILTYSGTSVASDGGASTSNSIHPRRYGTQPRVLGHYSRDQGYLTLEQAVHKMTGLPAAMIGMVDRGLLAAGMAADVTVFDPETIIDHATFDEPRQYAEGVQHVLVGGQFALRDGELTGTRVGSALRRAGNMISRPYGTPDSAARVRASGRLTPIEDDPGDGGQTFATDFGDDTGGQPPATWSTLWRNSDWTVLDNPRRLQHVVDESGGRRGLTWDEVGEVDGDVEIYARLRGDDMGETLFQIGFYYGGATVDESRFYYIDARMPGASSENRLRIARVQDSSYHGLANARLPFTVEEGTWYRVLLQRRGMTLRAKMWRDGEDEPQNWQVTAVDDAFHSGRVGMSHLQPGTRTEVSFVGVGTGSRRAPRLPDDPVEREEEQWEQAQLQLDIAAPSEGSARLLLTDRSRNRVFRGVTVGDLQVRPGWASATGLGRFAGEDRDRAFHLIVDESDTLADEQQTFTLTVEDTYRIRGALPDGSVQIPT